MTDADGDFVAIGMNLTNCKRRSLLFHTRQESPKRLSTKPQAPFNKAPSAVPKEGGKALGAGGERSSAVNGACG